MASTAALLCHSYARSPADDVTMKIVKLSNQNFKKIFKSTYIIIGHLGAHRTVN
jgi:hypothetical protein